MKKLLTILAALVMTVTVRAEAEFPDISIADLKKAIEEKKATVIDVNGASSYKAGHVPTAKEWSAVKADLAKALPADKSALVVAYCGGPQCSAYKAAAKAAKELGYTNVKHLSAGISGWKGANEKLEAAK
jgi:rhodanese-related sulfurtransferase